MSNCRLSISLDGDKLHYVAGDTVKGTVHVEVDKEYTCKNLKIEIQWRTHGRGNRDVETVEHTIVDQLHWFPGTPYSYPFSFEAPAKPLTYHGHDLNIDYVVAARADVPWKIDPKVEQEITISPGPNSRNDYGDRTEEEKLRMVKKHGSGMTVVGWIIGGIVIVLLLVLFMAFWWLFAIIALVFAIRKAMVYFANKRLGSVKVNMTDTRVVPGQKVPVSVSFQPPGRVNITKITALFKGQEVCSSGSGSNRRTYHHPLHEDSIEIAQNIQTFPGSWQEYRFDIEVPNISAYSFKSKDNRIEWLLNVHIDIPHYPDWKEKVTIDVVPDNVPGEGTSKRK